MNPLVSIVIPVYNCREWIKGCLESILGQSYRNIEVLVTDDGSSDGSGDICDRIAVSDNRVKVFHQENGGVNAARRKGVANASGEWLMFVDADDTVPLDCVESYMSLVRAGTKIVVSGYRDGTIPADEYCLKLISGEIRPAPWGKFFLAEHFKANEPFLERQLVMGEDLIINLLVGMDASEVVCTSGLLYNVNSRNAASVTKTFKHTWEYEKYYFRTMFGKVVCRFEQTPIHEQFLMLVRKSQLNGIKYVMLDGNKVDYNDPEFKELEKFFSVRRGSLGMSERLIFSLKNAFLYRTAIATYLRIKSVLGHTTE